MRVVVLTRPINMSMAYTLVGPNVVLFILQAHQHAPVLSVTSESQKCPFLCQLPCGLQKG